MSKDRVTVSIDPDLIAAGAAAVAEGRAESLSAWVNEAMADKAEKDRRLAALAAALADYESEFGVITEDDMAAQARADKKAAAASQVRIERLRGRA